MSAGRVVVYYSWSRLAEAAAPYGVIEDRFPTLFESRRMRYPRLREFADPERIDQGVSGFIEHILKRNFAEFVAEAGQLTGRPATECERVGADGTVVGLDDALTGADTVLMISFDSLRTGQRAGAVEIEAARAFLATPGNLLVVAPHHDIGDRDDPRPVDGAPGRPLARDQEAEFRHHGDPTIPPRQGFGGFARSLLAGLGVPVRNRFGLRPATAPDGSPGPIVVPPGVDRLGLLDGVATLNLHPHLPHLQRVDRAVRTLDVLARQPVETSAPAHEFGRPAFDAILQSRPGVFAGDLLVTDATAWSSTAGGLDSLRRLWRNVLERRP
jgi:hypothetical protein